MSFKISGSICNPSNLIALQIREIQIIYNFCSNLSYSIEITLYFIVITDHLWRQYFCNVFSYFIFKILLNLNLEIQHQPFFFFLSMIFKKTKLDRPDPITKTSMGLIFYSLLIILQIKSRKLKRLS